MKSILLPLILLPFTAVAMSPDPGDPAEDVTFALGSNFAGSNFGTLTNANLSDFSGKVVLIAYYTPW